MVQCYVGLDLAGQPMVDLVTQGWTGAYRTEDVEGRQIVASFAPVPGTSWGLVMEENWAALTETSRRYGRLLIALLALGVLVPTVIVRVGVRRITRPIGELIGAARQIAGGHLNRRVEASSGDEIEALADQFNQMAEQLQESYTHLEHKVADRTRELATLNTISAQVSHSLDLSTILTSALDQVIAAIGMDSGQASSLVLVISVPLIAQGRTVGAINLGSCTPRPVTAEEISLLASIGQQIGVAVENARLYEQAQPPASATPAPLPSPNAPPTATVMLPTATAGQPPAPAATAGQKTVQVFLIAVGDNGQSGKMIGCGDSAVPVPVPIPATEGVLRAALNQLLSLKEQFYGQSGLYNALYQSDLQVADVTIESGTAIIELSGNLMLAGECDSPRVKAQIKETALQFNTVQAVSVVLNGVPLAEVLSLQG